MTSLIGARRRAEEFDAAISSHRAPTPEVEALLSVVDALRAQEPPVPRPEFSAALRERLMAEADQVLVPSATLTLPPRRTGSRERRLTIAASALVLIGGSAGMAAAAQNAAPGDALYPIKRGLENAQRTITTDDSAKGEAFLSQADDRLSEVGALVERDASSLQIADTLQGFVTQTMTGSELLLDSFAEEQDPAAVEQVRSFVADALVTLTALAEVAPADVRDEIAEAGFVLQRIDEQAAAACADCSDLPPLEVPTGMQQTAQIMRAMEQVRITRVDNTRDPLAVPLPSGVEAPQPSTEAPSQPGTGSGGVELPGGGGSLGVEQGTGKLPKNPDELLGAVDDATGGLLGTVGDTADQLLPGELGDTTDDLLP